VVVASVLPLEGDLLPGRRFLEIWQGSLEREIGFLELEQGSRELRREYLKVARRRFC
jgi:hypothetical protein